jgi:CheY-like chemotaxis protein
MTAAVQPTDDTRHTLHLLMMEDRLEDFELVVHELGKGELRIAPTRVETEAGLVAALERQPPDLVLCDHGGVAFDSFGALARVRGVFPDVPFIVVTGMPGDELMARALERGADDWVSKNRLTDLLPAVRRALRQARDRRRMRWLEKERESLRVELLALRGGVRPGPIVPICASCKKIRNDRNEWVALERYFDERHGVRFSHGLCPVCVSHEYAEVPRPLGMG